MAKTPAKKKSTAGRKPAYLKVVESKEGFEPHRDIKVSELATFDPPDLVNQDAVALAEWRRIVPLLQNMQYLKELDIWSLAQYCLAVSEYDEVTRDMLEHGYTYVSVGRNGEQFKNRPEVARRNDLIRTIRAAASDFGLSPAARLRLAAGDQGDLFDQLNKELG